MIVASIFDTVYFASPSSDKRLATRFELMSLYF